MARLSISIFWRNKNALYTLEGKKCSTCGRAHFPPKDVCPYCGSRELVEYRAPSSGILLSWTKLYEVGDDRIQHRPVYIGLVRLGEMTVELPLTDITDESVLKEGIEVELVLRKYVEDWQTGLIYYGQKARPKIQT